MLDCCLREDPGAGLFGDWIEIARTKIKDSTDSNRLSSVKWFLFLHFVQGQMLSQGTLGGVDHLQGKSSTVCHWRQGDEKQWSALCRQTIICDDYHRYAWGSAWGDGQAKQTHLPRRHCNLPRKQYDLQACWWRNFSEISEVSKISEMPKRNFGGLSILAKEYLSAGFTNMCSFSICVYWGLWSQQMNEYEQP